MSIAEYKANKAHVEFIILAIAQLVAYKPVAGHARLLTPVRGEMQCREGVNPKPCP